MKLGQKQELFARLEAGLVPEAERHGYTVRKGECQRDRKQALRNSRTCRICKTHRSSVAIQRQRHLQSDHKFRAVGIAGSLHCLKLAQDVTLFKNGKPIWDSDEYGFLHDWWDKQHPLCSRRIRWDGGHFSITHGGRR